MAYLLLDLDIQLFIPFRFGGGKTRIQFFNIPDFGFLHGHAFCLSGSGSDLDQWVPIKFETLVLGVVVSVKG